MFINETDYEHLPITNNFIFCKVMSNKELCKKIIEALLKISVKKIEYVNSEQQITDAPDEKTVRFDVYVKATRPDEEEVVLDIEMQMVNTRELPKRARFYQSMIDTDNLPAKADFKNLKESYVIFMMPFDLFGKKLPAYTFENVCLEDMSVKLNDKTKKIFYNFTEYGKEKDPQTKKILQFFATERAEDDVTGLMDSLLKKARANHRWRNSYMTLLQQKTIWQNEAAEEAALKQKAEDEKIIAQITAENSAKDAELEQMKKEILALKSQLQGK